MDESKGTIDVSDEEETRIPKTPADPEEAKQRAISFISDVLQAMGMKDEITAEFEDDILCVNIEGEDMGIMIGKRGQTLDSLQYLTSLVVNKGKSSYTRVKVDTEDYRNRRKATLENLAKNIAIKVKKTRRPVFLEPMNPYERRIIHSALQNDPYVTTHSEGEEPYRKVVVTLKKDRERDDRDRSRSRGYSRYNNNHRGHYDRGGYNRRNYDRENYESSEFSLNSEPNDFVNEKESVEQSEE
ncbi:MAG: protein jag [Clostridiales bacterium]|nr:protein jag [Clostridiales bacterium]